MVVSPCWEETSRSEVIMLGPWEQLSSCHGAQGGQAVHATPIVAGKLGKREQKLYSSVGCFFNPILL